MGRLSRISWLIAIAAMMRVSSASAGIIYVSPGSATDGPGTSWINAYHTIEGGVGAAGAGDTVMVGNGAYTPASPIVVTGTITVMSADGAAGTVVQAQPGSRGFTLDGGAVLDGFTVRDCQSWSWPGFGAGVHCSGGSVVRNCRIIGNQTYEGYGGGVWCDGSTVENCVIQNNVCHGFTSGMWGEPGYGGGLYCTNASVVQNCTISSNEVDGGYGMDASSSGDGFGGGICAEGSNIIRHCTISHNIAKDVHGLRDGIGGGVFASADSFVKNTIVYFNTGTVSNNAAGGILTYTCTTPLLPGAGNISGDPRFVNGAAYDYHLQTNSPCIDAGTDQGVGTDLDGVIRPIDGDASGAATPDMGAYEAFIPDDLDGDGRLNDEEIAEGLDPKYNETFAIGYGEAKVTNNPASYGLYTSNTIADLDMGYLMLSASNGMLRLELQLQHTEDLTSGTWSNAGPVVKWQFPASGGKGFYRVRGR